MKQQRFDQPLYVQPLNQWAQYPSALNQEQCSKIIQLSEQLEYSASEVGSYGANVVDLNQRRGSIIFLPNNDQFGWLFEWCAGAVNDINHQYFGYDLDRIELLQFSRYQMGDYFAAHIDQNEGLHGFHRKLSFTIQLTDPALYEGGELVFHAGHEPKTAPREQGTMIAFPSFTVHEVRPVTAGVRYALVGWAVGPAFK